MKISAIRPDRALPGGIVRIELSGVETLGSLKVLVGGIEADVLAASTRFLMIRIPETDSGEVEVILEQYVMESDLEVGWLLADHLHPVSNPVVDRRGNIYTTLSGARGEEVPFGVHLVTPDGHQEAFLGDITNPTGLAIGPDDQLYISSRHTGTIYRSSFDKQLEKFAEGLGIASGLAFDSQGNLYVGDRSGPIYRIDPSGQVSGFCELEPSVSAFHLAIDAEDHLYVTGPTLATQDCIYRIGRDGVPEVFFKGFGRPQGLAFSPSGVLLVTGSYRGRKGVYSIEAGKARLRVSAAMLVGMAFTPAYDLLYLADSESLFEISYWE
ncbi:MAG: SMP-30/gluconolactonase/LRE family protein [Acidobacteriota bacterium]|nr:MAG: SMP-30/gluconolactonase/LRE family protein [Acidobacteriota bacterium]